VFADGGLDWTEIEKFDEWLLKKENYKKIIPEEKGVVVLKVRRSAKDYGDSLTNVFMNGANHKTYFLIRNGDNLYRIWADLSIGERVFPAKEEFENKDNDPWFENRVEDKTFTYRQNALVLQGLLDRCDLLKPHPLNLSFFKPDTQDGNIVFIRDDEYLLPPNRLPYLKWKKELNSKIKRGTRIFFAGFHWRSIDPKDRIRHHVYDYPNEGIYSVKYSVRSTTYNYSEKVKDDDEKSNGFACHYNPKDDVWKKNWGRGHSYSERKKAITFYLYYSDDCVFNYDLITLEEIEYYIHSRIDRHNYLDMLPILIGMKKNRIKEIKWEKAFVNLLATKTSKTKKQVWDAINWWKHKNIWKRPIMEDDAKAVRMIEGRLKRI